MGVAGKFFLLEELMWGKKCLNPLPSESIPFEDASARHSGKVVFGPVFPVQEEDVARWGRIAQSVLRGREGEREYICVHIFKYVCVWVCLYLWV